MHFRQEVKGRHESFPGEMGCIWIRHEGVRKG
jgi:hypothetical protein